MQSKWALLLSATLAISGLALAAQPYGFYYDRTPGHDLVVNLLNPAVEDVDYRLTVYATDGSLLWSGPGTVEALAGRYIELGQLIPEGERHWGVAILECNTPLVIGLEYLWEGTLVSVDHVTQRAPTLEPDVQYWIGAYHAQPEGQASGLVVMNPWPQAVACTVSIYRQDGVPLHERSLSLPPYSSHYVNVSATVGYGPYMWGLVDVRMQGQAVLLAMEYYTDTLKIDNISQPYYP